MPNSLLESQVQLSEFGFQIHGELHVICQCREGAFSVGSYVQLCSWCEQSVWFSIAWYRVAAQVQLFP